MKALKDKRVLIVSSEVVPYMPQSEKAVNSFQSSKKINDNGGLTRIFMPKYGLINERRHQLHEVIRLSGMNMVINDLYMPLIIKVASIPKERMQVYFIDNEDCFKKKELFYDKKKQLYKDNDLRMIFFVKGVIETVKKLESSLEDINVPITVSIIGCVVNGPGEASQTQIGLTGGGKDDHMMYLSGIPHHKVTSDKMIEEIISLVEKKSQELQNN